MKRFCSIFALAVAVAASGCGGSNLSAEAPPAPPAATGVSKSATRHGCIDFDHPENSLHPHLVVTLESQLEPDDMQRCFQVHSIVETGVATDEGFNQIAVLLERHESELDVSIFDWTNLKLSPIGTFAYGEFSHVEMVDPGRRAVLVVANGERVQTGIVFVPNLRDSKRPHDQYVPASACLLLRRTGARRWWRTETRIDADNGNLIVEYVGVDAESFHREHLPWNADAQHYVAPDGGLAHDFARGCAGGLLPE